MTDLFEISKQLHLARTEPVAAEIVGDAPAYDLARRDHQVHLCLTCEDVGVAYSERVVPIWFGDSICGYATLSGWHPAGEKLQSHEPYPAAASAHVVMALAERHSFRFADTGKVLAEVKSA
jgi:hypothetical protein